MKKKVVIAGGTGFIGKYFAEQFRMLNFDVVIISQKPQSILWSDNEAIIEALENATILINLAGKSVDCRYNKKNKSEILMSRVKTTRTLGEAILKCNNPPELWINSSTATIYRHAEDRPMTEKDGEIGTGFSVNVATNWEQAFFSFQLNKTRQVALRMAIVLGKSGGVIKPLLNLVKLRLGGNHGSGRQMFSWIHIEDLFNIILFILNNSESKGIYNCSSPNPVNNEFLMRTIRQKLKIGFGLPLPKWLLEVGAVIIKTETELILKSRWVVPERILEAGYVFKYPNLPEALDEILEVNVL